MEQDWLKGIEGGGPIKATDCIMFLRDLAMFLYENAPQEEKEPVAILTVALAKTAELFEDANNLVLVMSSVMQKTLRAGEHDEDSYLSALSMWATYNKGF